MATSGLWASRHLLAVDLAAFFGAAAVLGSLFMAWYQISISIGGASLSASMTALSPRAGGWRWVLLYLTVGTVAELLIARVGDRSGTASVQWPHRGMLALLSIATLVLVLAAMLASPLNGADSFGPFSPSLGAGAYVGLAGGVVGTVAAALRFVTAPPHAR